MSDPVAVTEIKLVLPEEAYSLLVKAANEAGMALDEFARICVYSTLANYVQEVPCQSPAADLVTDVAHDVVDAVVVQPLAVDK